MEKKTPLYQTHVDMGGKIVEFGGFLMPVQYPNGVIAEHMAVREKAGLFDVSHMGELRLKGLSLIHISTASSPPARRPRRSKTRRTCSRSATAR